MSALLDVTVVLSGSVMQLLVSASCSTTATATTSRCSCIRVEVRALPRDEPRII